MVYIIATPSRLRRPRDQVLHKRSPEPMAVQVRCVRELNTGPTGEDIVNAQYHCLNDASLGAVLISMHAVASTKRAMPMAYAVNPTTHWVAQWL